MFFEGWLEKTCRHRTSFTFWSTKKDTTDVVVSLLAVKFLLESDNNVKNWRVVVKVVAFVYKVEITS